MSDDNTDTTVSEPETTPVVEDTSTNEETPDTEVDLSLEDDDTSFDDLDDDETEETDDSEDEIEDTEPAESEEESREDEAEEQSEADEEKAEDTTAEDIKKHNAEMAAKRIAERQAKQQAKEEQQQKYLDEAEDNRDLALRQLQIDAYNNNVEKNTNKLTNGIERAVADIDLFRTGSTVVKEQLAKALDTFERIYVEHDSHGEPIKVKGDVYEYLQNEADSIRQILKDGARNQTKAKTNAKTRTETLPTRAPKEPKIDPDLAAFDEEVAKWS